MLGDPAQLAIWCSKRQQSGAKKLMEDAERMLVAEDKRKKTASKRSAATSF